MFHQKIIVRSADVSVYHLLLHLPFLSVSDLFQQTTHHQSVPVIDRSIQFILQGSSMTALNSNHHLTSSHPSEQQAQLHQTMAGVGFGSTGHPEGGATGISGPTCDNVLSTQQYSTADTGEQPRIESNYDSQGIEKRLDQLSRYISYNSGS